MVTIPDNIQIRKIRIPSNPPAGHAKAAGVSLIYFIADGQKIIRVAFSLLESKHVIRNYFCIVSGDVLHIPNYAPGVNFKYCVSALK